MGKTITATAEVGEMTVGTLIAKSMVGGGGIPGGGPVKEAEKDIGKIGWATIAARAGTVAAAAWVAGHLTAATGVVTGKGIQTNYGPGGSTQDKGLSSNLPGFLGKAENKAFSVLGLGGPEGYEIRNNEGFGNSLVTRSASCAKTFVAWVMTRRYLSTVSK